MISKRLVPKLLFPFSNIMNVSCSVCGGQNILHEQKEGRGLPPKGWVRKMGDNRRISWRGTWDVWTCKSCGETWRKLR